MDTSKFKWSKTKDKLFTSVGLAFIIPSSLLTGGYIFEGTGIPLVQLTGALSFTVLTASLFKKHRYKLYTMVDNTLKEIEKVVYRTQDAIIWFTDFGALHDRYEFNEPLPEVKDTLKYRMINKQELLQQTENLKVLIQYSDKLEELQLAYTQVPCIEKLNTVISKRVESRGMGMMGMGAGRGMGGVHLRGSDEDRYYRWETLEDVEKHVIGDLLIDLHVGLILHINRARENGHEGTLWSMVYLTEALNELLSDLQMQGYKDQYLVVSETIPLVGELIQAVIEEIEQYRENVNVKKFKGVEEKKEALAYYIQKAKEKKQSFE